MIKIENISFSYGKHKVLNNISAEFNKGEVCAVAGVNGCGKTTLLKLLGRFYTPEYGTITIDSKPFSDFEIRDFAKQVSYLPQHRSLTSITVAELVSHGRFPYLGFSKKLNDTDKEMIENALEITKTTCLRNRNITDLSGGERQRVYIAMTLAQDTPYILLDEPTTYLDISYSFEIMDLVLKMKELGKGIIIVIHDLSAALKYCDKILLLDSGKIVSHDIPKNIINDLEQTFNVHCTPLKNKQGTEYIFNP